MNNTKLIIVSSLFALATTACAQDLSAGPANPAAPGDSDAASAAPPSPEPATAPTVTSTNYTQQIVTLASKSSCATYSFKSRGRAPAGFVKGLSLSFARSLCRVKKSPVAPAAKILSLAETRDTNKDALSLYKNTFNAAGIPVNIAGEDAVRAIYSLGMGLGMRESSGKYCEGWDVAAGKNRPSSEAEAGLFQASYNSMGASSELKALYQEYQADPSRCLLNVFKEGVSCKAQTILGTGAGATYQTFAKSCPAFVAEYSMTLLRLLRKHFGPINRQEAELVPACGSLMKSIETLVDGDPEDVCAEIY
jgi:hypothetical protein